jgi:hypothetical protein
MNTMRITKKINSGTLILEGLDPFIGKKVDILINRSDENNITDFKSVAGIFHKYHNPSKISNEKQAWKTAVREKYDN